MALQIGLYSSIFRALEILGYFFFKAAETAGYFFRMLEMLGYLSNPLFLDFSQLLHGFKLFAVLIQRITIMQPNCRLLYQKCGQKETRLKAGFLVKCFHHPALQSRSESLPVYRLTSSLSYAGSASASTLHGQQLRLHLQCQSHPAQHPPAYAVA